MKYPFRHKKIQLTYFLTPKYASHGCFGGYGLFFRELSKDKGEGGGRVIRRFKVFEPLLFGGKTSELLKFLSTECAETFRIIIRTLLLSVDGFKG